jgi:hypothetical protein
MRRSPGRWWARDLTLALAPAPTLNLNLNLAPAPALNLTPSPSRNPPPQVWALIFAPFLFKWALGVYMRASPIQRGTAIGGSASASRNFVIQVVGAHHSGVLHEILNAIHGEGMDVLECRVETDGDVDCNYFVVQSRGKQKDFDDEKLEEVRHHITEILGDPNAVVMFESVADEQVHFGAIEVQIVSDNSKSVHGGVLAKQGNTMSLVAKRIAEFGLDVEEMDEQHKVQIEHGLETEMERDLFYAVRSQTSDEAAAITHKTVQQLKRALQSMLRDEEVKAEVVVKPVADRTKGFSELQTFDPQQAVARARGTVWELLCFGPHNVELLSTAVRRLTPLGLRLLHAAHSHAHVKGEAHGHEVCSRIYVEHVQGSDRTDAESEEEVTAFRAAVLKVRPATYLCTRAWQLGPEGTGVRMRMRTAGAGGQLQCTGMDTRPCMHARTHTGKIRYTCPPGLRCPQSGHACVGGGGGGCKAGIGCVRACAAGANGHLQLRRRDQVLGARRRRGVPREAAGGAAGEAAGGRARRPSRIACHGPPRTQQRPPRALPSDLRRRRAARELGRRLPEANPAAPRG